MADFKATDPEGKNHVPKTEGEAGKASDINTVGFLDDDLDEDFIREEDAEAFLNEIGDFFDGDVITDVRGKVAQEKEDSGKDSEKDDGKDDGKDSRKDDGKDRKDDGKDSREEDREKEQGDDKAGDMRRKEVIDIEETALTGVAKPEAADSTGKRPGRGKRIAAITAATITLLLLACGGSYMAMGSKYNRVFFPNTQINGIDASAMTVEEVKSAIASGIDGYVLTIDTRGEKTEQISRTDINLRAEFDGSLEKLLEAQEPVEWLKYELNPSSYQIKTMIAYDEQSLNDKINGLDCMNPALMTTPQDAKLSEYLPDQGYTVVPELQGTTVKPDVVKKAVEDAVLSLEKQVSIETAGAYLAPAVTKEDAALLALCGEMNKYVQVTVTYGFGDGTEVLSGDRIKDWLVLNEDHTISINAELAAGYVEELAIAYDTYNKAKTLKTSYGPTIEVRGGQYGFRINRAAETEALIEVIKAGESMEREPVYSQKGASRTGNDYGNTYVEMNLTAQRLFFYKNGSLLVESDFVSGNLSRGWTTPPGSFPLTYKERNATLKGENYRTPVDYWMPFNGGIGMHDAKWRSSFGGTIYKTGGSHGCINLPHGVAKKIYENISPGMPVLCYNLSGTESGGSSQTKPPETTAPSAALPPEQLPETPLPNPELQPTITPQPSPTPETQTPETQAPPETLAPAGPGSDPGNNSAVGPGSV